MDVSVTDELNIGTGELASMFRRDAARLLRMAAMALEDDLVDNGDRYIERAHQRLATADALEFEWEREHPDEPFEIAVELHEEKSERASDATEATPHVEAPVSRLPTIADVGISEKERGV